MQAQSVKKDPPVSSGAHAISVAIQNLEAQIHCLEERIQPILTPQPIADEANAKTAHGVGIGIGNVPTSELAFELERLANRVNQMTGWLARICDRAET